MKSSLLILLYLLIGCSIFEEEEERLPGERISVFELDDKILLKANKRVEISEAVEISDWSQQHQNNQNHLFHFKSNKSLKPESKIRIGELTYDKIQHTVSPIIEKEFIYYCDKNFNLFSRNLETGKIKWKLKLDNEKTESLAFVGGYSIDKDYLIVTTSLGNIYAINKISGKLIWLKSFLVQFSRPPLVSKNKIFVITDDNQTFALSLNGGDKIWSHSGNIEEISIIGGSKPIITGNVILISYSSGEIYALNENDGSLVWFDNINDSNFFSRNTVNDIQAPLSAVDNLIFSPTFSDKLIAYNLKDGKKKWTVKLSSINPLVISGETIFALDTLGRLLCLDKKTGKLIWAVQLRISKDGEEVNWFGPLLSSNKLILTNSIGSVLSLSPFSGKILSKMKFDGVFVTHPIQNSKKGILISKNGTLYVLG